MNFSSPILYPQWAHVVPLDDESVAKYLELLTS
jgi:hypothetical protein